MNNSSVRKYDPLLLPMRWYLVLLAVRGISYGLFLGMTLILVTIVLELIFDAALAMFAVSFVVSILLTLFLLMATIQRDRVAHKSHIANGNEPNELPQNGFQAVWEVLGDDLSPLERTSGRSDRALYQFIRYGKASWQRKAIELTKRVVGYVALLVLIIGFILPTPIPWELAVSALIIAAIFNFPFTAQMLVGGLQLRQIASPQVEQS